MAARMKCRVKSADEQQPRHELPSRRGLVGATLCERTSSHCQGQRGS